MPCGGYHRNKRLFCEADARWAIYHSNPGSVFFRCTYCARGYRDGWLGEFVVERLMGKPPERLVAA